MMSERIDPPSPDSLGEKQLAPHHASVPALQQPPLDAVDQEDTNPQRAPGTFAACGRALRRRWLLAVGLGLAVAVLAGTAAWQVQKDQYTAVAVFRVAPSQAHVAFDTDSSDGLSTYALYKNTLQHYVTRDYILASALDEVDVSNLPVFKNEPDPVRWLAEQLQVSSPSDSQQMTIGLTCENRRSAACLLAAVVKAFGREVVMDEDGGRGGRLDILKEEFQRKEGELKIRHGELQELSKIMGTADGELLAFEQQIAQQQFSVYQAELSQVRFSIYRITAELDNAELELLQAKQKNMPPEMEETNQSQSDPSKVRPAREATPAEPGQLGEIATADLEIQRLQATIENLENAKPQIERRLLEFVDSSLLLGSSKRSTRSLAEGPLPSEKELESLLARLPVSARSLTKRLEVEWKLIREELQSRSAELKKLIPWESHRARLANLNDRIRNSKSQLVALKAQEATLYTKANEYQEKAMKFGNSSYEVERLSTNIDDLRAVLTPMAQRREQLDVEKRAMPRVSLRTRVPVTLEINAPKEPIKLRDLVEGVLVEDGTIKIFEIERLVKALTPTKPDRSSRNSRAALFALFGMLAAVAGVVCWGLHEKRVGSLQEVTAILGLEVVGAIPHVPARALQERGKVSNRHRQWRSRLDEAIRGVVVRLLHEATAGQTSVIMVSSANSGEGKTTLATHLAKNLAQIGVTTLLADFDLRRPMMDKLFGLQPVPGISEMLRRETDLTEAIQPTQTENLSVITSGRWTPQSVAVLANGNSEQLFAAFRERFQFVILDASPILGVAETRLLSRHADTVLLSILCNVSETPKLMTACQLLETFGVRSLGAVVTGSVKEVYYHNEEWTSVE